MNAPCAREFPFLKPFLAAALVVGCASSAHAIDKTASTGGAWNSVVWISSGTDSGVPTNSDFATVGSDRTVTFGPGTGIAGQIRIGDTNGSGTITVGSGTLSGSGNGSSAVQIGYSNGSTGTLNVTGGRFQANHATNGWITVGSGTGSVGNVNVSGGVVSASAYIALGGGAGSTGNMTVSGNALVTTGTDFNLGRALGGTSTQTGNYSQSNGTLQVARNVRIGSSSDANQTLHGTMLLTGGTTSVAGTIYVGRTAAVGAGSGLLTVGANANLETTGSASALSIAGNGELVFQLGASDVFNAIDLTSNTTGNALAFSQIGAKITIDGANLVFSEDYTAIDLILYGAGRGPSAGSLTNLGSNIEFINFDPQYTHQVAWLNDRMQLQLSAIPEPTTTAMLLGAGALGWVVFRRRRSQN